ncbi:MAG: hypothetical protein KH083_09065 [Intestinibacter bartlettii]|uniref:hypothetical protein n=1 Tax=Intestinibacter bartlettii TaxID=261299 RepID=UPI00242D72B9|nr:hypothetical protein [Intestinibacter bartlettii]MBS7148550.1 hypothetical protein [Intestinibacter bartlettii]
MFKKVCAIFLSFVIAFGFTLSSSLESYAYSRQKLNKSMQETAALMYKTIPEPVVASIGGEWTVLSLARSGIKVPKKYYEDYYKRVEKTVKDAKGILHRMKFTEYSRVILALTAINKDVTDVGGYNLLSYLSDFDNVKKQGINGPIFALIAFDSGNYDIPIDKKASVQTTRQGIIDFILDKEIHKGTSKAGGWALSGTDPDPDITFMAIQSLANYMDQKEVKEAVDRALKIMSKKQLSTGGYNSWGTENCESTAQAIVALTALGIDIDTDSRFIKTDKKGNKNTLMDGMMQFYCKGGGFAHVNEGYDGGGGSGTGLNAMATDQGMYALDAYYRYINGKNKLYDMTDASQTLAIGNNPDLEKKPNNNDNNDNNNRNNGNNNQNTNQGNRNNGNTNGNINGNTGNKNVKTDNQGNKKYTSNVGGKKVTTTENKSATISIKTIYSGEKDGLIPENKKCVIIQFEKKEKEQIVGFKVSEKKQQYLYYSKELSKKSGCATYIALFDTSVEKEALLNMDNYEFHKIQKEDNNTDQVITDATDSQNKDQQQEDYIHPEKYEITFGDVNNDKVVNAQDILDVQSILSGKLDLTDERQIIAINVSMDSKIDNGDINQIMDNFVSKKGYTIFEVFSDKKDDKDSNNKSSDKENTSNKTSKDSQKEDIKQND